MENNGVYRMIFQLDKQQQEKLNIWLKEHTYDCKNYDSRFNCVYAGAIDGTQTYKFTPTSLGTCVEFECICGKTVNLTDFEDW